MPPAPASVPALVVTTRPCLGIDRVTMNDIDHTFALVLTLICYDNVDMGIGASILRWYRYIFLLQKTGEASSKITVSRLH